MNVKFPKKPKLQMNLKFKNNYKFQKKPKLQTVSKF